MHQGIEKYGNDEGTQKLPRGPERYCHAIAAGKDDAEAMTFALDGEPTSATDLSDKYLAKWQEREDFQSRISYLQAHPDEIKKFPREKTDPAKPYNPRVVQGGVQH